MVGATLFLASPEQLLKAIVVSCYSVGAVKVYANGKLIGDSLSRQQAKGAE